MLFVRKENKNNDFIQIYDMEEKKLLNKAVIFVFFAHKKVFS